MNWDLSAFKGINLTLPFLTELWQNAEFLPDSEARVLPPLFAYPRFPAELS